ncbi:MAG: prolipoprotein diacylglyceryl transferase family protein, partial [Chloroflexota bacterium]
AAGILYARWKRQPVLTWTDVAAPGLLTMQALGRWGNFFNQELYGPPTDLPWGVAIDCAHRTATWACPPLGTTAADAHFAPLFLYESLSGAIGAIVLLLVARWARSLRPGDLTLLFFAWYGTTRFLLEPLRSNNWTIGGIATASLISGAFVLAAVAVLAWRHRPGAGKAAAERDAAAAAAVPVAAAEPDVVAAVPDLPVSDAIAPEGTLATRPPDRSFPDDTPPP